jgi:hypothetical protein
MSSDMNIRFCGLLFVSGVDSKNEAPNMRRLSATDRRISVYLKLASRLANGIFRNFGRRLLLLTNRAEYLDGLIAKIAIRQPEFCSKLDVLEIPFAGGLPAAARFHSATNKIFVLEYFAQNPGYHLLLDLDMVCQCPFSDDVWRRIGSGLPLVYDISEQVFPAYGYARIAEDLRKFCGDVDHFCWYGGEFIGGRQDFFAALSALLQPMIQQYGQCWETLHHQGDEIIVSSALNLLRQRNGCEAFVDVGSHNVVRRHWGIPTAHEEPNFRKSQNLSFVHLPAMKGLLGCGLADTEVLGLMRLLNRYPPILTKAIGAGLALLS